MRRGKADVTEKIKVDKSRYSLTSSTCKNVSIIRVVTRGSLTSNTCMNVSIIRVVIKCSLTSNTCKNVLSYPNNRKPH